MKISVEHAPLEENEVILRCSNLDQEMLWVLSILRSGKASGVRFHTINKICYYLNCDVGDILRFDGRLEEDDE